MTGYLLDMRPRGAGGGGNNAPSDATYIVQTPNADLTNEQALSLLTTGLLKNTTGAGVLSIAAPTIDYASAAQGALADTAVQPGDLATVAFSGAYGDLSGLPTLGTIAALNSPLPVANGGTAATTDSQARANLGLAIGVNVQAYDATLAALAALVGSVDKLAYFDGSETMALTDLTAFARTILDDANQGAVQLTLGLVIGTNVQAWDADLDTIAGLSKADGNFIVGDGAAWTVESGATARTSLGLGSIATVNSPVPIVDGGSGQTAQQAAIDALTNVAAATNEHVLTKDTATGNAIFKATGGSTLPVADTQTIVKGSVDATKLLRFEVDGFTTGTTRVLTPPNANATIAGLEVANIFTATQTVDLADGDIVIKDITADANSDVGVVINGGAAYDGGIFTEVNGTLLSYGINVPQLSSVTTGSPGGIFRMDVRGTTFPTFQVLVYEPTTRTLRVPINATHIGRVGVGDGFTGFTSEIDAVALHVFTKPSTTNAIVETLKIEAASSGTAAAGFGPGVIFTGESSTSENQSMSRLTVEWVVATHASRTARTKHTVYDTAEREYLRGEASGSAPMIGFLGAAAIARPATYTLASTATRTMPTPEAAFTGQDNAQVGNVYAKSADIITLQTRLNNVEGVLRQLIIDLASTSGYGLLVAS